jgi:predicted AlkP superfamily phosphohydrolase/phosphomutase
MTKTLIIGIDGGSPSLIMKWINELPTFKKLITEGTFGALQSTIPVMTSPAWACMQTGRNPGKLGMYDFMKLKPPFNPCSSDDWWGLSMWKELDDYGFKCGILNTPMTYPPHKLDDGFIVTGTGTPTPIARYTYPRDLQEELEQYDYEVFPPVILTLKGKEAEYEQAFYNTATMRTNTALSLIDQFDCDIYMITYFVSDAVQHYFWKHMIDEYITYKDVIKNVYHLIDTGIALLKSKIGDCNIIVVSDHGFQEYSGSFSTNKWLEEKGYLYFKENPYKTDIVSSARDLAMQAVGVDTTRKIAKALPEQIRNKMTISGKESQGMEYLYNCIDKYKTKAYALGVNGAIFCNKETGNEIEEQLNKKYPQFQTFRKKDIYWGAFAHEAPEISIIGNKYFPIAVGKSIEKDLLHNVGSEGSGTHHRDGVFIGYGKEFYPNTRITKMSIYDVMPTIMHMLGLPISRDVDGRVIEEILQEQREVEYII